MARTLKKKSFIFNVEWREILMDYPGEVRLEVYDAIVEYVASGTVLELKPMAKMAFSFIKKEIDYNNQKYEEVVEKRKAASKKAAEMRHYQSNKKISELATSNQMESSNTKWHQMVPNGTKCNQKEPSDTKCDQMDPDNVYDNDNDNDIKETTTKVVAKKTAAKAATLTERKSDTLLRKEKFYESLVPFLDRYPKSMIREFFDYWSEMNKSCTKMKWEQQSTWELKLRLANWANRQKEYLNGSNKNTTKQEANEYAMQKLAERIEQREQGLSSEIQNLW